MTDKERLKIRLSDKYEIIADSYQYILKRISENGSKTNIGYYSTLGRLVNGLLENEIKTSGTEDLKALYRRLLELERTITTNLEKVVHEIEQMR